MASVGKHQGAYRVLIVVDGKRKAIRLPDVDKRSAESFARHVEAVNAARLSGASLRADTAAWLGGLPDQTHGKLAKAGLVEPREKSAPTTAPVPVPIGEFITRYVESRPDVKPATLKIWDQTRSLLVEHFGDRCIRTINGFDARGFHSWLTASKYAPASVSKYAGFARQFFTAAIEAGIIEVNPFARIRLGNRRNDSRQQFIDWPTFERVLEGTADRQFRLVLVLSRIGGLRIPSELQELKWQHIDRKAGKILIHSPKTARHPGGESRQIPLFPELVPYLDDWWDHCPEGEEYVISGNRGTEAAWRTRLGKLLDRLGIPPWPRIYHNLRSSRQTELESQYPTHIVCRWLGNSPEVARQHYLQVRDEDYLAGAEKLTHFLTQQAPKPSGTDGKPGASTGASKRKKPPVFRGKQGVSTGVDGNRTHLTSSQTSRRV